MVGIRNKLAKRYVRLQLGLCQQVTGGWGDVCICVWDETYVCAVSIYLWIAYLVRSGDVSPLVQEEGASGGLAHTGCNV